MTPEEFKAKLQKKMAENRKSFEGQYKNELDELMGLSRAEIDATTPGGTDLEIYDQLVTVVKEASAANISQAQLKQSIQDLGRVAVKIASKIPGLL